MRTKILVLLLFVTSLNAMAQGSDSLVIRNAKKVDVRRSENGDIQVNVFGKEGDESFRYSYKASQVEQVDTADFDLDFFKKEEKKLYKDLGNTPKTRWSFGGLHAGVLESEGFGIGIEAGIHNLVCFNYAPIKFGPQLRSGIGLSSKLWFSKRGRYYGKDENGVIDDALLSSVEYVEGMYNSRSTIQITSLQFCQDIYQPIGRRWFIGLGAIVNWNFSMKMVNRYKLKGTEMTETLHDLNYKPFTVDWKFFVGTRNYEYYVMFMPDNMFKNNKGPRTSEVGMGISMYF